MMGLIGRIWKHRKVWRGGEENHPGRHGSAEERRGEGAVGAQKTSSAV